jgi:hypothetical protein
MYTMLHQVLLGLMADSDSPNYVWRFLCKGTDPVIAVFWSCPFETYLQFALLDRGDLDRAVDHRAFLSVIGL